MLLILPDYDYHRTTRFRIKIFVIVWQMQCYALYQLAMLDARPVPVVSLRKHSMMPVERCSKVRKGNEMIPWSVINRTVIDRSSEQTVKSKGRGCRMDMLRTHLWYVFQRLSEGWKAIFTKINLKNHGVPMPVAYSSFWQLQVC